MRSASPALVAALVLCTSLPAAAQWQRIDQNIPLGGPYAASIGGWDSGSLVQFVLQGPPFVARAFRSTDSGTTWTEASAFGSYSSLPLFVSSLGGRLAAGAMNGPGTAAIFLFSDDGGATWREVVAPGIASPRGMARIGTTHFAITTNTVARSQDDGQTWSMLAGSPSGGAVLATSQAVFVVSGIGAILRSADLGATWTQLTVPPFNLVHGLWNVGDRLYAHALVGDILESNDQGSTWSSLPTFNQTAFLSVVPSPNGATWFPWTTGSQSQFFVSTDRGATAQPIMTGYPVGQGGLPCAGTPVATPTHLVVTTQCFNAASGIWRWASGPAPTSVESPQAYEAPLLEVPWPNPTRAGIRFRVSAPETVRWEIVDLLGRRVRSGVADGPGQTIEADLEGAAPGLYLLRTPDRLSAPRPFVLVR